MSGPQSAFHVLGYADADARVMKNELVFAIRDRLDARKVTSQKEAAELIGWATSDTSLLLRGITNRFTVERIMQALNRLDPTVRVSITVESEREPEPAL